MRLMDEDATHVIEEHESIMVKDSVFDEFMAACNKVKHRIKLCLKLLNLQRRAVSSELGQRVCRT